MSVDSVLDGAFTRLLGKIAQTDQQQAANARVVDVALMLGGPGVALSGNEAAVVRLGLNGPASVVSWSAAAMIARSPFAATCTVDILAGPTMSTVVSICGDTPIRLVAQTELDEQVPLLWSSVPDPSWLVAIPTVVDHLTEVIAVTLRMTISVDPFASVVTDNNGDVVTDNNGDVVTWG